MNSMSRFMLRTGAGLLILASVCGSQAQTFSLAAAGLRGALSANSKSQTFEQAEAFGIFNLPWRCDFLDRWHLQTGLDLAAGLLRGRSDNAFIGSVGPDFVIRRDRIPLNLEFGVSPTILSRDEFGTMDFGMPFQFTTHALAGW